MLPLAKYGTFRGVTTLLETINKLTLIVKNKWAEWGGAYFLKCQFHKRSKKRWKRVVLQFKKKKTYRWQLNAMGLHSAFKTKNTLEKADSGVNVYYTSDNSEHSVSSWGVTTVQWPCRKRPYVLKEMLQQQQIKYDAIPLKRKMLITSRRGTVTTAEHRKGHMGVSLHYQLPVNSKNLQN